jgi:hypothetical protein
VAAYAAAAGLDGPSSRGYLAGVYRVVRAWVERLRERGRIGRGFLLPLSPARVRRWPWLPWEWEAEIGVLEAAERGAGLRRVRVSWDDSRPGRVVGG